MFKKLIPYLLIIIAVLLSTIAGYSVGQILQELKQNKEYNLIIDTDRKEKTKDKIDLYLDRLIKAENCPPEGIIDSNSLKSRGWFCFQEDTFIRYIKKYNEEYKLVPNAEDKEILNLISDNDLQYKLVRIIIREEPRQVANLWYTTVVVKGLGYPPKYD